jgi:hypothetical protein
MFSELLHTKKLPASKIGKCSVSRLESEIRGYLKLVMLVVKLKMRLV